MAGAMSEVVAQRGSAVDDGGAVTQATLCQAGGQEATTPHGTVAESPCAHSDEGICAICLDQIDPADTALVRGCEHCYHVLCILRWAQHKEICPQCKAPMHYLYTHKLLDGSLSDYLVEESLVLLQRAPWFTEHVREIDAGPKLSAGHAAAYGREELDPYAYYDDSEDADDYDEVEAYYMSSAAGRARIVLGNRRWGENGVVRSGRMYARPTGNPNGAHSAASSGRSLGKAGKGSGKAGGGAGTASGAGGSSSGAGGSAARTPGPAARSDGRGLAGPARAEPSARAAPTPPAGTVLPAPPSPPPPQPAAADAPAVTTAPSVVAAASTQQGAPATAASAARTVPPASTAPRPSVARGTTPVPASSTPPARATGPAAAAAGASGGAPSGRRARRNQRRAVADTGGDWDDYDYDY